MFWNKATILTYRAYPIVAGSTLTGDHGRGPGAGLLAASDCAGNVFCLSRGITGAGVRWCGRPLQWRHTPRVTKRQ